MSLSVHLREPVQAHAVLVRQVWPQIKAGLEAGKEQALTVVPWEDARSAQQNRFYWAACLREIAEQASIGGQRYQPEAWHELFKRQFLGFRVEKYRIAGKKKQMAKRVLRSTTGLSVKKMSTYLDQVQSYASTELDVRFSCPDWERWDG